MNVSVLPSVLTRAEPDAAEQRGTRHETPRPEPEPKQEPGPRAINLNESPACTDQTAERDDASVLQQDSLDSSASELAACRYGQDERLHGYTDSVSDSALLTSWSTDGPDSHQPGPFKAASNGTMSSPVESKTPDPAHRTPPKKGRAAGMYSSPTSPAALLKKYTRLSNERAKLWARCRAFSDELQASLADIPATSNRAGPEAPVDEHPAVGDDGMYWAQCDRCERWLAISACVYGLVEQSKGQQLWSCSDLCAQATCWQIELDGTAQEPIRIDPSCLPEERVLHDYLQRAAPSASTAPILPIPTALAPHLPPLANGMAGRLRCELEPRPEPVQFPAGARYESALSPLSRGTRQPGRKGGGGGSVMTRSQSYERDWCVSVTVQRRGAVLNANIDNKHTAGSA
jgi:hypothetical protein